MHEEILNDSIYQGVSTFSEVLARAKSKDEEARILQHQKELKDMIQCYTTTFRSKIRRRMDFSF